MPPARPSPVTLTFTFTTVPGNTLTASEASPFGTAANIWSAVW